MEDRRVADRREISRWEIDSEQFTRCPKFVRHDISEEQIKDIVKRIRDEDNRELGAFIREQGKGVIGKVLFMAGLAAIGIIAWLNQHGIKVL